MTGCARIMLSKEKKFFFKNCQIVNLPNRQLTTVRYNEGPHRRNSGLKKERNTGLRLDESI